MPIPKIKEAGPPLIAGMRQRFTHETRGAIPALWQRFTRLSKSGRQLADGPLQLIEHYDSGRFDPRTGLGGFGIWIPLKE